LFFIDGKIDIKQIEMNGLFGLAAIDFRKISELEVAPADSSAIER
jgi:hypothetical protein